MSQTNAMVQKLWNFATVLRDDGISYGDYVEQLTYLVFLKMDYERTLPPFELKSSIPQEWNWESLLTLDGVDLEVQYRNLLEALSKTTGLIGLIFRKSQNKIQNPALLKRLVNLIHDGGKQSWLSMEVDVKGDIYEGLLEKNAQDTKSGAGQYFTPRVIIDAMVEIMKPTPNDTIFDPACGTGGFLLSAYSYIHKNHRLNKEEEKRVKEEALGGCELVSNTARLCVMNMYLHNIGGEESPIEVNDSLLGTPTKHYSMILSNPPFGSKSAIKIINEDGKEDKDSVSYQRDDFWASTANKQLNFVQHINSLLKINGRAAVVVPDNVLFEDGAGETIRKKLLENTDLHTILRLPTGLFYAQGVRANVIFFDRKGASEDVSTKETWIYDLRTNQHFTLKRSPMKKKDLEDFIKCYNPKNRHKRVETDKFKKFTYKEIIKRDNTNLDIFWLKDDSVEDSADLPEPKVLIEDILENLEYVKSEFEEIYEELGS
ncbi:MAG: N-6 DNA methylase [Sulfurimonas sp.]|nr:N-6 DNA methylase [Sulfurimonas sp.]